MTRDRHGRTLRADGDPRRRPPDGFRIRHDARFAQLVTDAIASLPDRLSAPCAGARIIVEDIPPPPMTDPHGDVLLATYAPGTLTLYRRPVELRADSRGTLEETLMVAIGQAVARTLGFDDDIDKLFGD